MSYYNEIANCRFQPASAYSGTLLASRLDGRNQNLTAPWYRQINRRFNESLCKHPQWGLKGTFIIIEAGYSRSLSRACSAGDLSDENVAQLKIRVRDSPQHRPAGIVCFAAEHRISVPFAAWQD